VAIFSVKETAKSLKISSETNAWGMNKRVHSVENTYYYANKLVEFEHAPSRETGSFVLFKIQT